MLWDKIVLRGESTMLNLRDMKSKYFFFDDGNGLRLFVYFFSFIKYNNFVFDTEAFDIMGCSDTISYFLILSLSELTRISPSRCHGMWFPMLESFHWWLEMDTSAFHSLIHMRLPGATETGSMHTIPHTTSSQF